MEITPLIETTSLIFASIFCLMLATYILSSFEKGKSLGFTEEIKLFLFLSLWFLTLGLFPKYSGLLVR